MTIQTGALSRDLNSAVAASGEATKQAPTQATVRTTAFSTTAEPPQRPGTGKYKKKPPKRAAFTYINGEGNLVSGCEDFADIFQLCLNHGIFGRSKHLPYG